MPKSVFPKKAFIDYFTSYILVSSKPLKTQ